MKKQTFSVLFFIKPTQVLKTGEATIQMRITLCGQRWEMYLKARVVPKLWNQKKERATGKDGQSIEINMYLDSIRARIYEIQREVEDDGTPLTLDVIKAKLTGADSKAGKCKMFFSVFQEEMDRMDSLIGIDYVKITISRYKLCLKYFKELYAKQSKLPDIPMKDVSNAMVIQFETYLKTEKKCCQNTVIRYMKCFKKIIHIGLSNGWITKDPFANIKFREVEVIKDTLTVDEVMRMYKKVFDIPRLSKTRDIFVFCCFSGLAFVDVSELKEEHIVTDEHGNKWIHKGRVKTDVVADVPLSEIPLAILDKYKDDDRCRIKGVLLPVDVNQRMNSYLKEIADLCGIKKKLSTHTARHTFATLLVANHAALKNVAAMMGHNSTRMTERYARAQNDSILNDLKGLSNCFANM